MADSRTIFLQCFLCSPQLSNLPLLWLGIAVYAVLVFYLRLDDRVDQYWAAIPFYATYLQEVPVLSAPASGLAGEGPTPFSGVWSIGIEEKFYLVWPLLAFVLPLKVRVRLTVAAACLFAAWGMQLWGTPEISRFVRSYAPIALGCCAALLLQNARAYHLLRRITYAPVALPVLVAFVVLQSADQAPAVAITKQCLVAYLLVHLTMRPASRSVAALEWSVLRRVGLLSYGIYLFHSLCLKVVDRALPSGDSGWSTLISLVVGTVLTVGICQVLHVSLERPMQRVGRRVSKRLQVRQDQRRTPIDRASSTGDAAGSSDVGGAGTMRPGLTS